MNNTTGQTPCITPTSGAADLPEALRRSTAADGKTELFNLPGYPLMVRAVDFNRIHAANETLRAGYAAARLEVESLKAQLVERAKEHADELTVAYMCGVSGPPIGQPQAMPDLSQLTERGAVAWAGVDAQGLRECFTAADMATASAQGFRDGVASTAPPTAQAEGLTWTVFNSGAQVVEVESLAEAMEYLTPARLARQWCAVCVVDQSNLPPTSADGVEHE